LNTYPFPLAINHADSIPFGNTYIASSPLLLFASTRRDNPAPTPVSQNAGLEMKRASMRRWERRAARAGEVERRMVRKRWRRCL
jgi:hypothetical protein